MPRSRSLMSSHARWTIGCRRPVAALLLTFLGLVLVPITGCNGEGPAAERNGGGDGFASKGGVSGRALLIGVGDYALDDPKIDLQGIDLDLKMMRRFATSLGFRDGQIRVLSDAEATQQGVESAIEKWLIAGTGPGDRALLYFSGHGSHVTDRNGDEDDGRDEFLVLHDFNGTSTSPPTKGMLLDDQLNEYLEDIPADETLLIVDACHSGTTDKGYVPTKGFGELELQDKTYVYPGMPSAGDGDFLDKGSHAVVAIPATEPRYVGLMAARDTELSRASPQGSIFTLGLLETLDDQVKNGKATTPGSLIDGATGYIKRELPPYKVFNPQLAGNQELKDKALELARTESGDGPNWREAKSLVEAAPGRLRVTPGQSVTRIGKDLLTLSVEVPAGGGYLNVVEIGPDDEATVLFPNQYRADNRIDGPARTFHFPEPGARFEIITGEPPGENLITVFFTRAPVNLYRSGYRKAAGSVFVELTELGLSTLAKDGIQTVGYQRARRQAAADAWAGMTHVEVIR